MQWVSWCFEVQELVHDRANPANRRRIFASLAQEPAAVTTESDVAEAVWRAANDTTGQLRFPAGADAVALAQS
jgi:hypothetical protein